MKLFNVFVASLMTAGLVSAQPALAAHLKLISLTVVDQEDDTGPDEPYLIIDGKKIDCGSLSEGGTKDLSTVGMMHFDGNIKVTAWDYDWRDSDDKIGEYLITAPEQFDPSKELECTFKGDDAEYLLRYKVLP